jgi:membrane protease YdiL (CAAX protease family)
MIYVVLFQSGYQAGTRLRGIIFMKPINIGKFFLDYFIGSGLVFLTSFLLVGNLTIIDTRGTLTLAQACDSPHSAQDILQSAHAVTRDDEHCEVVSPCVDLVSVRCEGLEQVSEMFIDFFTMDLLIRRVKRALTGEYGFAGYSDRSKFRVSTSLIVVLLTYGLILAEAGALLFALWRQNKLRQTFSIPPGSKKEQLLKPLVYAVLFALAVSAISYQIFSLIGRPEVESREIMNSLLTTLTGVGFALFLAPLAEELIFRGVLLRFFIERNKLILGIVVVSLIFSLLHGLVEKSVGWQIYVSSVYFVMSLLLCRLYVAQKNLWSPIIFHSAYNGTMVVVFNIFAWS